MGLQYCMNGVFELVTKVTISVIRISVVCWTRRYLQIPRQSSQILSGEVSQLIIEMLREISTTLQRQLMHFGLFLCFWHFEIEKRLSLCRICGDELRHWLEECGKLMCINTQLIGRRQLRSTNPNLQGSLLS